SVGGPKSTTLKEDDLIIIQPNVDRFKTAPQISVALREEYGLNVSVTTNSRRLRKVGLYGRRP
ncbi:uncharacterized protein TRIADDRAFT_33141, partial [Trichoplax adhaerens]